MPRLNDSRIGGFIGRGMAVRAATSMASSWHTQHAAAILFSLDGEVTVTTAAGALRARAVVLPPNVEHAAICPGPTLGFLFDPQAYPHVAGFTRRHAGPLDATTTRRLSEMASSQRADLAEIEVLAGIAVETAALCDGEAQPLDRRVALVLDGMREDRRAAVARTGLSPAHLAALFTRDVGVTPRAFVLWHRLLSAVSAMARVDASHAAHQAGFADLAHFSRTCRRLLGYSPTALRDGSLGRS